MQFLTAGNMGRESETKPEEPEALICDGGAT